MSDSPVRVDRVLGGGPFLEVGQPRVAEESPDGELVVVAGDLGPLQWHGQHVARGAGWYQSRLAVYRAGDLSCVYLVPTRWPANAIAFHPVLPIVAVGTGSYDGGYHYEGELLVLNLVTGQPVSLLQHPREVRKISWRDGQTLDLVLAVPTDDDKEQLGATWVAWSIRRDDWDVAADRTLSVPPDEVPVADDQPPDPAVATDLVERLCRERGLTWEPRRAVWAVRDLPDGRVITGHQVHLLPGGETALTLDQASVVTEVAADSRKPLATWDIGSAAVMTVRSDGWWALRDAEAVGPCTGQVTLMSRRGDRTAILELGRYDLFNHYFDIRYAPDLLFLQGSTDKPWHDKWVVAVDPPSGEIRRLFPLEWDADRGGHLFGGPGAYLAREFGTVLVHAGAVHDGRGLLPGNSFVACRAYPSGELRWVFTTDVQATDLDADGDYIFVIYNSGELVVLRATDGSVRARLQVTVDGRHVIPLSIAVTDPGFVVIGTLDGRVLSAHISVQGGEVGRVR